MAKKKGFVIASDLTETIVTSKTDKKTTVKEHTSPDPGHKTTKKGFTTLGNLDSNTGKQTSVDNDYISRKHLPPKEYPWFERREFIGTQLREKPFIIEKIRESGAPPTMNWLQILAAPAAMLLIASVMMAIGMANMLMMLPMQLVGVITAVVSYFSQKKKHSQSSKKWENTYKRYLQEVEAELKKIAQDQREALRQVNPTGASCMDIIEKQKAILWSRDIHSKNFLDIPLGVGQADLSCPIEVYRPGLFDDEVNPLSLEAVALAERFKQIQDVPISFSLLQNNSIAVSGDRASRTAMIQQMLLSLSTLHTPEDLKIAIVYSKEDAADWSFFRFLPHVWDANRTTRLIADSGESAVALLNHFADLAESRRKAADGYHASTPTPFYILVIAESGYLSHITDAGRLLPRSPLSGMTTLVATDHYIPSGCHQIIEVRTNGKHVLQGNAYPSDDRNQITPFSANPISSRDAENIVRAMAPIRMKSGKEGKGLPPFISLFKGRNIQSAEELRIAESWKTFNAAESMAVSLGVDSNGNELIFDIHKDKHGPMGLVAGTTTAGKTELLQTWIIQMASKFSPEEVNFVLFDFKGTSLIDPLKKLPHLVGDISNTGPDDSGQDFELRYCAALKSEIKRRQNLFTDTGSTNILDYQKKYRNHQVADPMPFLMIILDEFAQIKSTHPDFMKLANTLFSTGAALGMYVILSTQNPASAISTDIRANSAFQLCARVADSQDSREMIGVPDAAHLPKIPGRVFLRVKSTGILSCFQTYYAGAAYNAKTHESENAMPTALIEVNGEDRSVKKEKPDSTELKAAVEQICMAKKSLDIPDAHMVWLPPLAKKINLYDALKIEPGGEALRAKAPEALTAIIGFTDDPTLQTQYATTINFGKHGSALVCGGPTCGKTTFLLTASMSLIHLYGPQRLRLYYIDGGGGTFKNMEKFPHTARALNAHMQPEECAQILVQLKKELQTRQQKLAARGAQDMASYRKLTGEKIPDILLTIDDIGEVRKSLDLVKTCNAVDFLAYLLKFGPSTGIYLLLSASKQTDLYKLSDGIHPAMRFALRMDDKSAVKELLGLPAYPPMITIPGRGIHTRPSGEKDALVFQTMQPWTTENSARQLTELLELGQRMADKCNMTFDDQPIKVPEHIPFGSVSAQNHGLVLGLALDGSGVVEHYVNADKAVLTLVGTDAALRTSVAAMITRQAVGSYDGEFTISAGADVVSILEALRTDIKNGNYQKKFLLVIHDFPEVYRSLPGEQQTLLDKIITFGGLKFGVDCLFTGAPKSLGALPDHGENGVVPANVALFRKPMLYLDNTVAAADARFHTEGQQDQPLGAEDAEYVDGFDDQRHAVRMRRMLSQ